LLQCVEILYRGDRLPHGGEARAHARFGVCYGNLHAFNACATEEKSRVRWLTNATDLPHNSGRRQFSRLADRDRRPSLVTLIWNGEAARDPELGLKPVGAFLPGPPKRAGLSLLPTSFVADRDSYLSAVRSGVVNLKGKKYKLVNEAMFRAGL
jgi:hypothetical protein